MLNRTWKRNRVVALCAVGLLVALGACGDDDGDDGDATEETTEETTGDATEETTGDDGGAAGALTIEGFAFSEATAAAGATVSISNEDGATHTVTSDDDAWESVSVGGGESGELTAPSEPGEFPFHCEIHSSMTGTLVVE